MSNFNTTTQESLPALNSGIIDPDRLVFFGCMFGALVLVVVNMMQ